MADVVTDTEMLPSDGVRVGAVRREGAPTGEQTGEPKRELRGGLAGGLKGRVGLLDRVGLAVFRRLLRRYEQILADSTQSELDALVRPKAAAGDQKTLRRLAAGLRGSMEWIFDCEYYLTANADIRQAGVDPGDHYFSHGHLEGRKPNALFDPAYYARQAHLAGPQHALLDFARREPASRVSTHPLFDAPWYARQHRLPPTVGSLEHYLRHGRSGTDPAGASLGAVSTHPLVDLRRIAAGLAKRQPPTSPPSSPTPAEVSAETPGLMYRYVQDPSLWEISPHVLFDPAWYWAHSPDTRAAGVHPLGHFLEHGGRELRDPHPLFSCSFYLRFYGHELGGGINPLLHYVLHGWKEGKSPSAFFDTRYYDERYPPGLRDHEVGLADYLLRGHLAGRNPSAYFDNDYYRGRYLADDATGTAPLLHFALTGLAEKLSTHPAIEPSAYYAEDDTGKLTLREFPRGVTGSAAAEVARVELGRRSARVGVGTTATGGCRAAGGGGGNGHYTSGDGEASVGETSQDGVSAEGVLLDGGSNGGSEADIGLSAAGLDGPGLIGGAVRVAAGSKYSVTSGVGYRVAWYLPPPLRGSGGHRTILQAAGALARLGVESEIFCEYEPDAYGGRSLQEVCDEWFGAYPGLRYREDLEIDPKAFDLWFATLWSSPRKMLKRGLSPANGVYFVQDYEPWFHSMSDEYIEAESSYALGLRCVCIGSWLPHRLKAKFGAEAWGFPFGVNLDLYRPDPAVKRRPAVCFVHQPDKPRRCAAAGLAALALVKERMPNVQIYLYGSELRAGNFDVPHRNLGLLSRKDCALLYNLCSVGVCLSASNPSRVPFEMMACGLPVVDLDRENNHYDYPKKGVVLSDVEPEPMADAIVGLLQDGEAWGAHSRGGLEFMAGRDEYFETDAFLDLMLGLLRERRVGGGTGATVGGVRVPVAR